MTTEAGPDKRTEHDEILGLIFGDLADIDGSLEDGEINAEEAIREKCDTYWSHTAELSDDDKQGIKSFIINDAIEAGISEDQAHMIWQDIEQRELASKEATE